MLFLYNLFLIKRQRKHYHNDVEKLSIGAWWKIEEEGNFKWLHHKFKGVDDKTLKSHSIWIEVQDSFIRRVGLGEKQDRLIELKLELYDVICDRLLKKNRFLENRIQELEVDILLLENEIYNTVSITNEMVIIMMEDLRGGKDIDPFKISVLKFHMMMDFYSEKNKKQNRKQDRKGA